MPEARRVAATRAIVEEYPSWVDPLEALEAVRGTRHPALLFSGLPGHTASRYSILAWDPAGTLMVRGGEATLGGPLSEGRADRTQAAADPLTLLRALVPERAVQPLPGLPFAGGAIGFLGYGLRRTLERLPGTSPDPLRQPDLWMGLYASAVVFDAEARRVALVCLDPVPWDAAPSGAGAGDRMSDMRRRLAARPRPVTGIAPGRSGASLVTPRAEYLRRVSRALEYIAAGDLYQVNLSHRITVPFDGDSLTLFRRLARANPAPFAAYLDVGAFQIVGTSPERFLALQGERAWSSPIKGTRPRGATPEDDRRLAAELAGSAKERAENVMITDLVRNDLGRVAIPGSVRVASLCGLESFATVHHLVSTVEARLLPGRDRVDLLRALFPGGSMTGAPKIRAMEIIDELEGEERGAYAGGLGYLSLDGGMDFNIVIRTLLCAADQAHLRVGGAVVADSIPEREFRETLDKGRALLKALDADLRSAD